MLVKWVYTFRLYPLSKLDELALFYTHDLNVVPEEWIKYYDNNPPFKYIDKKLHNWLSTRKHAIDWNNPRCSNANLHLTKKDALEFQMRFL